MRRIIISEKQERLIRESEELRSAANGLPPFIAGMIEAPDNLLKGTGYFVEGALSKMALARQKEIRDYFSDDIESFPKDKIFNKLSALISKCEKIEEPIRENLAEICHETVVELFRIPENAIKIKCEIGEIPASELFHIKPDTDEEYEYEDLDDIENSDSEIKRRKIINAISYGAANRISEQSRNLWMGKIFDLNEELPHLYSQIMKINEYLVFNTDFEITDQSHKQGGTVKTMLAHEDEMPEIEARGIIFPILLQETVRGIIDILATYGLPDNEGDARRIVNVSDALENDIWYMRLGPIIWDKVCAAIEGVDTEIFPYFYKELVTAPSDDFKTGMKNIFAGTKAGKNFIKGIYDRSKYNHEYDVFSADLDLKREKNMITDEYISEEELNGEWSNQ